MQKTALLKSQKRSTKAPQKKHNHVNKSTQHNVHTKAKKAITTTTTTTTTNNKRLPISTLTTSVRAMGIKRSAPTGYATIEEAIAPGSVVKMAGGNGKMKTFTGPPQTAELQAAKQHRNQVDRELKEAKRQAEARNKFRNIQPDEEAVRFTQVLLTATLETEPPFRELLNHLASPLTKPAQLGYNPDSLPDGVDYTGFDTRYQRVRGFLSSMAEKLILERGGPESGLTFASPETLDMCVSNFPVVWQMYTVTGVNTDPLNLVETSLLGPVMAKLMANYSKRLPYGALNDAHWEVLINLCFNIDAAQYSKLRTCLDSQDASAIYRRQLDYVQSDEFKQTIIDSYQRYAMAIPSDRASRAARVRFVSLHRTLANDALAEHTMKNIAPKYGFDGDVGYFLLQKALTDFMIDDRSAAVLSLLNKEIEESSPVYASSEDIDLELQRKMADVERPDPLPEDLLYKPTQEELDAEISDTPETKGISLADARDQQLQRLKKSNPMSDRFVAKQNETLPRRFQTTVTSSAERAKNAPPAKYAPVRRGGLVRPQVEDSDDDNEIQLPTSSPPSRQGQMAAQSQSPSRSSRDPAASLYEDDDIDHDALPYEKVPANRQRPRWQASPEQTQQIEHRQRLIAQIQQEEREEENRGLKSFFNNSRPTHPGAGQSDGLPLSQLKSVMSNTGLKQPGMPPGAYVGREMESVPPRRSKAPAGENAARRGAL